MARTAVDDIMDLFTGPVDEDDLEVNLNTLKPAKGMSFPVPAGFGKMWKKRIDDAVEVYEVEHAKWDAIFTMYRETGIEDTNNTLIQSYQYQLKSNVDENIIRDNIKSIMRSTYMRNPHIEFTATKQDDTLVECLDTVLQFIMNKKTSPGLNMKVKARRWVMHGHMTNHGVLRLDYQEHEGSLDQAQALLAELEGRMQKAKSVDEIKTVEAQLQLLYEQMPVLETKGIKVVNVLPHKIIIDPNCTDLDLDSANWLAEFFDVKRKYVEEKFYDVNEDGERIRLADGKTADIQDTSEENVGDQITEIIMGDQTQERREYQKKGMMTLCNVYDKLTRRIYLFSTEDWSTPLWVYEDTLKLSRFFRHFLLAFSETVESIIQPGEPSFYVGHIHEINKINRKAKEIRDSAFGALIYNKNSVDAEEVKKLIKHLRDPNKIEAFGINKDETKKLNEVLEVFVPPAFDYQQLFNTAGLRSVIDKAASVSMVDRGEQFKTNTTNKAVEYYDQQKQQSNALYIESIEDAFESLAWSMSEILVSKYSKEDIAELIGEDLAAGFIPMSIAEFNRTYRMEIAAGSIEKPNTQFKKKEAIEIAQSLGQVGQATPATTLQIILRMFQSAFSNFLVKKDDWEMLKQESMANLNKGVSTNEPSQNQ